MELRRRALQCGYFKNTPLIDRKEELDETVAQTAHPIKENNRRAIFLVHGLH
jgi:hypothetical protein